MKVGISDFSLKTPGWFVFSSSWQTRYVVLTAVIDLEKVNNPEYADNNTLLLLMLSLSGTSRSYNYRDCPSPLDSPEC